MNRQIIKKYYPVPPIQDSIYEYQNLNKDPNLRNVVTNFFKQKILKWIKKYPEFEILKSKTIDYDSIYKILRKIVKKKNLNWYELRSKSHKLKKYFLKYLKIY
jgi:hypothetical protein